MQVSGYATQAVHRRYRLLIATLDYWARCSLERDSHSGVAFQPLALSLVWDDPSILPRYPKKISTRTRRVASRIFFGRPQLLKIRGYHQPRPERQLCAHSPSFGSLESRVFGTRASRTSRTFQRQTFACTNSQGITDLLGMILLIDSHVAAGKIVLVGIVVKNPV